MSNTYNPIPAAIVRSVGVRHGSVPGSFLSTWLELDRGLTCPAGAELKDTTLAEGCTYSVSMSSAAPISGFLRGVASFGGTVKLRRIGIREREERSGVAGREIGEDMAVS